MRGLSWLTAARQAAGLTQLALAERLGIPQSRISRWETGREGVPEKQLPALAEALGLEPGLVRVAHGYLPEDVTATPEAIAEVLAPLRGQ